MKKLLLSLLATTAVYAAVAQCNPAFTPMAAPQNNNLLRYTFANNTSFTPPVPAAYASYTLNYGDGTPVQNYFNGSVAHNYATPGTYAVTMTMTVTDSFNSTVLCTNTANSTITVSYPSCGTQISATNSGTTFSFSAAVPAGTSGMTYSWNFGDGSSSTLANPIHTYNAPGTYTVTLVSVGSGCQYSNSMTITVPGGGSVNCALLNATFSTSNNGSSVFFTPSVSSSSGLSVQYQWFYGDGTSGTQSWGHWHNYPSAGTYNALMIANWVDSASGTVYCTDSFSQIVTVNSNPVYNLSGNIYFDSSLFTPSSFMVYLIQATNGGSTLTAIDSTIANTNGGFINYSFASPAAGSYFVKASVIGQPVGTAGLIPTYHDSSLYWANAQAISFSGNANSANNHIWMRSGVVTAGPGFIGGNISQGANKGTSSGIPGMLVLLRNGANQLVTATYTDANGNYQFSSIPTGTYNIYPENMNYVTTPSGAFTISSTQTSVTGIDFIRDSATITPVALSVAGVPEKELFAMYPNPANGHVTIVLNASAHVQIMNTTGAVLLTEMLRAGKQDIDIHAFPAGVYTVRISNGTAVQIQKLMIQK